jgi:hypothetical protein
MKYFGCELSRDKTALTNIIFSGFVKNNIAAQELTFHVTVPRLLYTGKNGYQQAKNCQALVSCFFINKNVVPFTKDLIFKPDQ